MWMLRDTEEALGGAGQALTVESPGKPPQGAQICSNRKAFSRRLKVLGQVDKERSGFLGA